MLTVAVEGGLDGTPSWLRHNSMAEGPRRWDTLVHCVSSGSHLSAVLGWCVDLQLCHSVWQTQPGTHKAGGGLHLPRQLVCVRARLYVCIALL